MKTHNMKTRLMIVFALLGAGFNADLLADMDSSIAKIQRDWATANYETAGDKQEKAFKALIEEARSLAASNPDKAEPKVWLAIALSTEAGITGGFGALSKVKEARSLLEEAEKINANALNGSVYTSMGSLYYQVPGWPIGFGNDDKAEQYLQKALAANPDGIDPNYFYGDFMLEQGRLDEAIKYLNKAAAAPDRPGRPLADKGRRAEIRKKLNRAKQELDS